MLKNVKYNSGKCVKQIVFNPITGLPRPVVRADKNTKSQNGYTGTYQEICTGDILLRCYWENDIPSVKMRIINIEDAPVSSVELSQFLIGINPLWIKWLTTNDDNLFLPKGCGWDGVFSENDKLKYVTLQQNLPAGLPQEVVDRIANACYFTSIKEIDKPWKIQHSSLSPLVPVNKEYSLAIEEFKDGTTEVTSVTEDFAYQITKDTVKYILVKFVPLKMKGAEKIEWKIIQINH